CPRVCLPGQRVLPVGQGREPRPPRHRPQAHLGRRVAKELRGLAAESQPGRLRVSARAREWTSVRQSRRCDGAQAPGRRGRSTLPMAARLGRRRHVPGAARLRIPDLLRALSRNRLAPALGSLERRVLEALWRWGRFASVREVSTDFPESAYTTLMTT